jgi:2-polyprenyl-3-methyl-5-hydroxy-6-metoxy-1,4-benzoquinol methylase
MGERMSAMTTTPQARPTAANRAETLNQWWYYSIEIEPGCFTPGQNFNSISVVRDLLRGIDVAGRRCLDIGSMEGVSSVLMSRRGGHVTAYDRYNCADKIDLVKACTGANFTFLGGGQFADLPKLEKPFDVVVFAGMLYHMFDPMSGLFTARNMVRNGGVILIETAAIDAPGYRMEFNASGRFYPQPEQSNYWFPTPAMLEFMCRMARLDLLDVSWLPQWDTAVGPLVRLGLVCRAVSKIATDDLWLYRQDQQELPQMVEVARNYREVVSWDRVDVAGDHVAYTRPATRADRTDLLTLRDPNDGAACQLRLSDVY